MTRLQLSCQCGATFRSMAQEIYHRHNFPAVCIKREPRNFAEFVEMQWRTAWLREYGLRLYVRKGFAPVDFTIANVWATTRGRGYLTRFLDRWEPHYSFAFENVHNDRLPGYLTRRGYIETSPQQFLKIKT